MDDTFWNGKTILITGVGGSVGQALFARLRSVRDIKIVGMDIDRERIEGMKQNFPTVRNVSLLVADVCDARGMRELAGGVDIIIHAAAAKHVDRCEDDPTNALSVNLHGIQNLIDAARHARVRRVIFTSSDKAVEPTNVMGATKLIGERLLQAEARNSKGIVFASVRFGNICGSNDSVIPKFKQQIAQGGPVTVTHRDMTRYIMSMSAAMDIILQAVESAQNGEVYIPRMPAMQITTLANVMVDELAPRAGFDPKDVSIQFTRPRAGEKLFEKLCSDEELPRVREFDQWIIIGLDNVPTNRSTEERQEEIESMKSRHCGSSSPEVLMDYQGLRAFLQSNGLLD